MSTADTASVSETKAAPAISEAWLSILIGLLALVLALAGTDLLGWAATPAWTDPGGVLGPVSKAYAALGGSGAFVVTNLVLLAALTDGRCSTSRRSSSCRKPTSATSL